MDAEPPIASFVKSMLIGSGPVNANVLSLNVNAFRCKTNAMPPFTTRTLLSFVALTAFSFSIYNRLTIPGLFAGGLMILSATEVAGKARRTIAVQNLTIGYLSFLLEVVLCVAHNLEISQMPGRWSDFSNTVPSVSLALRSSLSITMPILIFATVVVATTADRADRRPSHLVHSALILTTVNVLILLFGLYAICRFGLR